MVDVQPIAEQGWVQLGGDPGETATTGTVNLFRGEPVIPPAPTDGSPSVWWDPDGAVHAYACLYAGAGRSYATRVCGSQRNLAWSCQVTCVGGDDNRTLWCVDQVRGRLKGVYLTVDGRQVLLREVEVDSGPVRVDRDVDPHRSWLPLFFAAALNG